MTQANGNHVNLAFADGGTYVSIAGSGELLDDRARLQQVWNAANEVFAEGSPEDPHNALLAVRPESASFWDSPAAPVIAWNALKAAISSDDDATARSGDHGTVTDL